MYVSLLRSISAEWNRSACQHPANLMQHPFE
jgi:hypothetical protein